MSQRKPVRIPQKQHGEAELSRAIGLGVLVVAVVVGIHLGSIPWRYRRQISMLHGLLLGGLVGFVMGRLTAGPSSDRSDRPGPSPRLPGS